MKVGNLLKIAGINLLLVLVLLFSFESYLRFTSPERTLPRNGLFDGKHYTWGHLVRNNRYGFRERDFAEKKPDGVRRIMVLGDSLTWGAGLSEDQRYTNRLERLLNAGTFPARYEVLNFGAPAAPTTGERDTLRKYIHVVDPDLIVVAFCVNDPQPRSENYSVEKEQFDSRYKEYILYLTSSLRGLGFPFIGKAMESAVYRLAERTGAIPPWGVGLLRTYERDSREWRAFERALTDIKKLSDGNRLAPPILAILNTGSSPHTIEAYRAPNDTIRKLMTMFRQAEEAGTRLGFRTYNHEMEIIEDLRGKNLILNELDAHPSAELNEAYAKKLYRIITAEYETRFVTTPSPSGRRATR